MSINKNHRKVVTREKRGWKEHEEGKGDRSEQSDPKYNLRAEPSGFATDHMSGGWSVEDDSRYFSPRN